MTNDRKAYILMEIVDSAGSILKLVGLILVLGFLYFMIFGPPCDSNDTVACPSFSNNTPGM
jgi:hypothetical protein